MSKFVEFDARLVTRAVMVALLVTAATPAFAASNGDWIKPFVEMFDNVGMGLAKLVAIVVGLGLLLWGLYTSIMGEFNMKRLGAMVIGGGIGLYGPSAIDTLLGGK
ncbi:TrbC/VirB2 family protein [Novispirillum itersonii]|uniref:Type IV secretory pathway VirB2 component (Pilin) n=1 Tax=Novispirillum itersonii TaxID=189 RepID=A0A7W9ZFV1_NOVIT|nr:TrbC/VirB2 family protein [Novispirillum itersonii]MBB6210640.1 type IV secretory pathway VirB2 component (pilin) [Novispirillum itersonii]